MVSSKGLSASFVIHLCHWQLLELHSMSAIPVVPSLPQHFFVMLFLGDLSFSFPLEPMSEQLWSFCHVVFSEYVLYLAFKVFSNWTCLCHHYFHWPEEAVYISWIFPLKGFQAMISLSFSFHISAP